MKLNKQQIEALATKFYNDIKLKIDKKNKTIYTTALEKFRPDYDKSIKILNENSFLKSVTIDIGKRYSINLLQKQSFKNYTDNYSIRQICSIKTNISKSDIIQDIILATIDSQCIEDIMKVLKTKYK